MPFYVWPVTSILIWPGSGSRNTSGHYLRARLIDPPRPEPIRLVKTVRMSLTDQVAHAAAVLAWPTVPEEDRDAAALDVLASILGGGSRWNRLFRALKYDRQLATTVSASHTKHRLAGHLEIIIEARAGQRLDDLIKIVDVEIERIKADGPTDDEVRKVKIEKRTSQIDLLDSVASKAKLLNQSAAAFGEPLAYRSVLARVFAVTPDDVRWVAQVSRVWANRTLGPPWRPSHERVGGGRRTLSSRQTKFVAPAAPVFDLLDRSVVPDVGPAPAFRPPRFQRLSLAGGLELLDFRAARAAQSEIEAGCPIRGNELTCRQGGLELSYRQTAARGDHVARRHCTRT